MTNRIIVRDYWDNENVILTYSRRDKGLIAIVEKQFIEDGNGNALPVEKFVHVNIDDLKKIIEMSENE